MTFTSKCVKVNDQISVQGRGILSAFRSFQKFRYKNGILI